MEAVAPLIDVSTARVLQAVDRFGKSKLSAKAEIPESSIRRAGRDGWNPTRDILRRLEIAAAALELEHGARADGVHGECGARNPGGDA